MHFGATELRSTWQLLLLWLLINALNSCESRGSDDDRVVFPDDAKLKTVDPGLQMKNKTNETMLEQPIQPQNQTNLAMNATEMKNVKEIETRIALDTLRICQEGYKLIGEHCRKDA